MSGTEQPPAPPNVKDIFLEAVIEIVLQAADPEGVGGEPRATIIFENLQNFFAFAEGVKNRCNGADVERVRAQPQQVACDAVQLRQNDTCDLRARGRFDGCRWRWR